VEANLASTAVSRSVEAVRGTAHFWPISDD